MKPFNLFRWILTLITIFQINSFMHAKVYYVASTGGSDSNSGTDTAQAWATWQKAFDFADAGDTVYFRDGVWYLGADEYIILDPNCGHGNNGTYSNPICFFNYPGETPILDAIGHRNTFDATAFDVRYSTYIKFRGLTVRNEHQNTYGHWIASMQFYQNGNLYLDRITCHSGGGYGIWISGFDTVYLTNCDSYGHADTLADDPGNRADGFTLASGTAFPEPSNIVYMSGCRAWNNSDDGFEISPPCQQDIHDNWAWNNGHLDYGAGTAFKYTHGYLKTTSKRRTYNNIAAFNKGVGFIEQNLFEESWGPVMEYYNNTAYKCKMGFGSSFGTYDCDIGYGNVIYKNNIVYNSRWNYYETYLAACTYDDCHWPCYASGDHNTWTIVENSPFWVSNNNYTVTDTDFILLDSALAVTQLSATRQSDGSLPEITFLKLADTSDFVDKGIDVGLGYNGTAPDLGAWECYFQPSTDNTYPFIEITYPSDGCKFTTESVVTITVKVEDTTGYITNVEFYNASDKLGESNSEPWSFAWDNLPIGSFYLTAVATDNLGAKATSSRVYVQVKPGVNMIYANPNNGIFTFALKDPLQSNADIKIASIDGKVIYTGTMFAEELTKQFDLSYIKSGIYILMLYSKDIFETIKFLKK